MSAPGSVFELLPGCHIVTIGGEVSTISVTNNGGLIAKLRPRSYAFRMRAGNTYFIKIEGEPTVGAGPTGAVRILAAEQDPQGHTTIVPQVRDSNAVSACRTWSP